MPSEHNLVHVTNRTARKFLLSHQFVLPPKAIPENQILEKIFQRLGCIQFDTINVVGRNADLALQARVKNYKPEILNSLLYKTRDLLDGWDKVASIFPKENWPYFGRHRARMGVYHQARSEEAMKIVPTIMATISERGPMSSIDFKDNSKTDWFWGPTSLTRASLEILYAQGKLGIHHRVNTRRYFDIINQLVPESILKLPDPFKTHEDYLLWHILRRIGSVGISSMQSGEHWGGIYGARKVGPRREVIHQLIEAGKVLVLKIENSKGREYYIRKDDEERLFEAEDAVPESNTVAFIAPLDNLIWNRKLIEEIFNFSYVWEVYKPKAKREYGYYVLPVLFKDRFIARADMKFDKKANRLDIINWWWEDDIKVNDEIITAIQNGLSDFLFFLSGKDLNIRVQNLETRDRQTFNKIQRAIG